MKNKYLLTGLAAATMISFSSCGKKDGAAAEAEKAVKEAAEEATKKDLSANETVEQWAKDLSNGQITSLWASLPASYQTDVEGLVHEFGAKVDGEVYNEALKTLSSVSSLLAGKKDIILEILNENGKDLGEDKIKSITDNYGLTVELINSIVNSKIKDVDGLKTLNMQDFLSSLQPQFTKLAEITRPFVLEQEGNQWLKDPKVELISENGDSAEIKDPASAEGTPMKLTRVESRWVPAEMASDWSGKMTEAKAGIAQMGAMEAMQKQQVLAGLRMVQTAATELSATTTKDEFMAKVEKFGEMFGGLLGGGQ